jgi:hypothetical protein
VARWRLIVIDALKNVQLNLSADIKNIPQRIFLDTNVVQYIHDFGEYIFENHTDSNDFFENSRKKKIHKGTFLYNEIEALNIIFSAVERTPFDFAISEKVFHEINSGNNHNLNRYFYDLWDYWQTTIFEYGDEAFTGKGETKAENLISDKSLVGALSKKDFGILHDAIEQKAVMFKGNNKVTEVSIAEITKYRTYFGITDVLVSLDGSDSKFYFMPNSKENLKYLDR